MRIVIADRFPVPRSAVAALVRALAPEAQVLQFDSAAEAMDAARVGAVDLLLCDWSTGAVWRGTWMGDLVEAVHPGKFVVLGAEINREACEAALVAGAWGHLPMTSSPEVMSAAINLILAGGTYFPAVGPVAAPAPARGGAQSLARLSRRQVQVLREIEKGRSNQEIADELGISVATVKLHVQAILKTLGVRNRTAAARLARNSLPAD